MSLFIRISFTIIITWWSFHLRLILISIGHSYFTWCSWAFLFLFLKRMICYLILSILRFLFCINLSRKVLSLNWGILKPKSGLLINFHILYHISLSLNHNFMLLFISHIVSFFIFISFIIFVISLLFIFMIFFIFIFI
jgi:hypothetical protein